MMPPIIASNPIRRGHFGYNIALAGEFLFVAARRIARSECLENDDSCIKYFKRFRSHNIRSSSLSAVYAFNQKDMTQPAKMFTSPLSTASFGEVMHSSGNYMFLADALCRLAPPRRRETGIVLAVDTKAIAAAPKQLAAPSGSEPSNFGTVITSKDGMLFISAPGGKGSYGSKLVPGSTGSVYAYRLGDLDASPKHLIPPKLCTCDECECGAKFFGWDLLLSGKFLFVAAPYTAFCKPRQCCIPHKTKKRQFGKLWRDVEDPEPCGSKKEYRGQTGAVFAYNVTNLNATPAVLAPKSDGLHMVMRRKQADFGESMVADDKFLFVSAPRQSTSPQRGSSGVVHVFQLKNLEAGSTILSVSGPIRFASMPGTGQSADQTPNQLTGAKLMYQQSMVRVGDYLLVAAYKQLVGGKKNAGEIFGFDVSANFKKKQWSSTKPQDHGQFGAWLAPVPGKDLVLVGSAKGPPELLDPKDGSRNMPTTFQAPQSSTVQAFDSNGSFSALFASFTGPPTFQVSIVIPVPPFDVAKAQSAVESLRMISATGNKAIQQHDCPKLWNSVGIVSSFAKWMVDPRGHASAVTATTMANDNHTTVVLQFLKKEKWLFCQIDKGCEPWTTLSEDRKVGKTKGVLTKIVVCAKLQLTAEGCCVNKALTFENNTVMDTKLMTGLYSAALKLY